MMLKQQRLCVNNSDDLNSRKLSNVNIDEVNAIKNSKQIAEEISKDCESSTEISTLSSPHSSKKEKGNKKNVWSKITLKFRFVSHLLNRSRDSREAREKRNSIVPNLASSTAITPSNTARKMSINAINTPRKQSIASTTKPKELRVGSIKLPSLLNRKLSIFDRKLSIANSYDLRTRYKSDSEKDSCSYTDDASNDYTVSLFEINSNSQLNNPNSIKCANRLNDYLYVVNSDNESIDLFNKYDKSLKPYIDTKLSNDDVHEVRTPVDLIATNTHIFVTDWLNDEVLVYNSDGQFQSTIFNNVNKYFASPWGISVDYFNDYLYVCNTSKNTVEVFNSRLQHYQTLGNSNTSPSIPTTSKSKTLPTSSAVEFNTPKWIINCDHWGFAVSDYDGNEIKLIDHCSNRVIRTIKDVYSPEAMTLVERTGTQLLVLCSHHKNILKMFDLLSGKLIKTYDLFSSNDQKFDQNNICSIYGLRGLCYSHTDEKIYFTDSIKNKIFICNL